MERGSGEKIPSDESLASLLEGFYERVALELEVDPAWVIRVARGETRSKRIEDAMRRELERIASLVGGKQAP